MNDTVLSANSLCQTLLSQDRRSDRGWLRLCQTLFRGSAIAHAARYLILCGALCPTLLFGHISAQVAV